ncbi:MAG: aminotransferase class V-fold PLP-dependent enzyme, partial [Clostridia bacterium]|nr:aminotransferase class V-fold PLP-dependent enzyme [Clostridia bacterium]
MIYLDNAATTYPKPIGVGAALVKTLASPFGNSGRGGHSAALRAAECVYEARGALSRFFGLKDERRVVFTKNATEALNIALLGILSKRNGVRVVTSTLEHNSVLRPLEELMRRGCIRLAFFEPCEDEEECLCRFARAADGGV